MTQHLLKDEWHEIKHRIAFCSMTRGFLVLASNTRFDGNGNSRVYFSVELDEKIVTFEKYDAAATHYNIATDNIELL